ncbi:sugar phosphate isomerase/epimerase family protein [Lawsonibacter sp. LCP25S3_G6]|uniref:sugar phosphate isomerase/epimerase family protein n=1 Tax=unclassified Lawsonibacter TaxID=2617946 RepID=UPI003F9BDF0F
MKNLYLSTFCVGFHDYAQLEQCIRTFTDFPVGVEFATSWTTPNFDQELLQQIPVFSHLPITLHAPFVEECTAPGSAEEALMEQEYTKACRLYHQFGASSMVMHTHEGSFPADQHAYWRARCLEVLLDWTGRMREQNINVTVENVGYPKKDNVLFDQEQFLDLFDHLPQEVGCLIDTGHAILNHWDIPGLIRRMGSRIKGYHLNNNDGIHDSHYPLYDPDGVYSASQIDEILQTIAQYTPDAHLILEYAPNGRATTAVIHHDLQRVAHVTGSL